MAKNSSWKKELARQVTVILLPHHSAKPLKVRCCFIYLLIFSLSWFSLTIWAITLAIRHIDYWGVKLNNLALKAKTAYFAQEVKKSQEKLNEVKGIDLQLRQLLEMKSKKAIIEQEEVKGKKANTNISKSKKIIIEQQEEATGGPSITDQEILEKLLQGKIQELDQEDLENNILFLNRMINERIESMQEVTNYITEQRSIHQATPNIWPVEGKITSFFGSRAQPWAQEKQDFHKGLDIAAKKETPVRATASGIVKLAQWAGGYGKLVVIKHGHGFVTLYAHNSQLAVKQGQQVKRGQVIAYVGSTGTATGAHLHYEVRINGKTVNPLHYMKK